METQNKPRPSAAENARIEVDILWAAAHVALVYAWRAKDIAREATVQWRFASSELAIKKNNEKIYPHANRTHEFVDAKVAAELAWTNVSDAVATAKIAKAKAKMILEDARKAGIYARSLEMDAKNGNTSTP